MPEIIGKGEDGAGREVHAIALDSGLWLAALRVEVFKILESKSGIRLS
jgi:hypothetical protein